MPKIQINFRVDEVGHSVKVLHGMLTGRREVYVDNNLVIKELRFKDSGSEYEINVGSKKFRLNIIPLLFSFEYQLLEMSPEK